MTPQEVAEKSAEALWKEDRASQWMDMTLDKVEPGVAQMSMKIQPHHCNGHGTCHGGITFMLADSCFAFACNSYNSRCVGQHNHISYIRPVFNGQTIRAVAKEVSKTKNSAIYDITVYNEDNKKCVEMRGWSRNVDGTLF